MAREYNFSVWVGRNKNPYSFVIRGWISQEKKLNIGVRMDPFRKYRYMEIDTNEWNPNNILKSEIQLDIGATVNEVAEYIHERIEHFSCLKILNSCAGWKKL